MASTRPASAPPASLLQEDIGRAVFRLALPVLCEQFLSFCVGFYDTWLSGRINAEATSAIGVAAYVSWLASMLSGLVAVGTTALVARHWGAGDRQTANRILNQSLLMAAGLGIGIFAVIWLIAPVIATALQMQGAAERIVVRYLRLDAFGHLFTSLSLIGAAGLRGAGDMRSPMLVLGFVSVANILFSSAFVFGWVVPQPLGIDGIVLGTVLSRILGGCAMIAVLLRGVSGLALRRELLKLDRIVARRILRIGGPAALDGIVMWAGQFLFLSVIAGLGSGQFESAVFAAHVVGIEVEAITFLPGVAWGHAAATLIGQSLGARNVERAATAGHRAVRQSGLLATALGIVFFLGADAIYALMHESPDVHAVGVPAFRMLAFFQIPLMVSIVYTAGLRGAGDTRYPMICTLISVLGVRVPLAYLCGVVLNGGLIGAWIGMCADVLLRAVLVALRFASRSWAQTEI